MPRNACCLAHFTTISKRFRWPQDGDSWTCAKCKARWIYVEDEAEGGAWHKDEGVRDEAKN